MSTQLPSQNPTAYLGIKETNPPELYFRDRAPTTSDYKLYDKGDIWVDETANEAYILVKKVGQTAVWVACAGTGAIETITGTSGGAVGPDAAENVDLLGTGGINVVGNPGTNTLTVTPSGGGTIVESITGDSGGAVGPDAVNHNINFLGNSPGYLNGIEFVGTPGANTLTGRNLRDFTTFVVAATPGETEYDTIQAAVDAANAAGGGVVQIRSGTYTENVTLYQDIHLQGSTLSTTIIGTHIPPGSGNISFTNLFLISNSGNLLASAAAGSAIILMLNCLVAVANGYTFNLPNWTGILVYVNCLESITSGHNGFINCTGGALVIFSSAIAGSGTLNSAVMSNGTLNMFTGSLLVPITLGGSLVASITGGSNTSPITISDTANVAIIGSNISGGAAVAITQNSPNPLVLSNVTINSTAAPDVITGAGAIQFGSVVFTQGTGINAGITVVNAPFTRSGPFDIGAASPAPTDDAYNRFYIFGGAQYAWGIDNSDSNAFKLTDGADPSSGNELIRVLTSGLVSVFTGDFEVDRTDIGGLVRSEVVNQDNTSANSYSILEVLVGGGTAGDPQLSVGVEAGNSWKFALDNSNADALIITSSAALPSLINPIIGATVAGEVYFPLTPAFQAYLSVNPTNVTGDGTSYTVAFDSEIFDQNSDYNTGTYTFTAPISARYDISSNIEFANLGAAHTSGNLRIVTSNRTYGYINNAANMRDAIANRANYTHTVLADMDAADTAQIQVDVTGGALVVGVNGATGVSVFCANLEC